MTRAKLSAVLVAVGLALPLAAVAEEAGVFKIPGTDSTIKIYGYVQLDGTVDFGGRPTDIENFDWATILPMVPADDSADGDKNPQTYLTARTSRFGFITSTPTRAGDIGVRLEGDFNGPNGFQSENYTNSVVFRLRHAYGTFRGLLVGQTWSTFLDLGAAPDTVDFNGPGSLALIRNPMIRYTLGLSPALNLQLAVENNRGQQFGSSSRFQMVPDLHANLTYSAKWGHLSLRGVGQTYTRQVGPAGDEENKSKLSISGAVSGSLKLGGDTLVAQFSGGPSIGRYLFNTVGNEFSATAPTFGFVTVDADDEIQFWTAYAYHVGFTHVWNDKLRSNLVWSQTFIQDAEIDGVEADNTVQEQMMQAFVNTFYNFAKTASFGLEYEYGQWKSFSTATSPELTGTQNRVTFTFHYNFY
jgi:hypothetical protein